jgi:hypothetical protein
MKRRVHMMYKITREDGQGEKERRAQTFNFLVGKYDSTPNQIMRDRGVQCIPVVVGCKLSFLNSCLDELVSVIISLPSLSPS